MSNLLKDFEIGSYQTEGGRRRRPTKAMIPSSRQPNTTIACKPPAAAKSPRQEGSSPRRRATARKFSVGKAIFPEILANEKRVKGILKFRILLNRDTH